MKTANKIHYVYKITNLTPTDERLYYIGVKSSFNPLTDNYMGSSKYLDEAIKEIGATNFKKEVLSTWETRELAMEEEIRLHEEFDVAVNKLFYNKCRARGNGFSCPSTGKTNVIDTRDGKNKQIDKADYRKYDYYVSPSKGMVTVLDTRDGKNKSCSILDYNKYDYYISTATNTTTVIDMRNNIVKKVSIADYNNNDYYISIMDGLVNVYDKRDGLTKQVTDDEFLNNEYYISCNKGKVTVFDTRDNITKQVQKSEYNLFDYYISPKYGKMTVIDTRDNTSKQVLIEDYKQFDYYVSTSSKKYTIYNSDSEIIFRIYGSFKGFCRENKLPIDAFAKSYKNNGEKLYQSPQSRTKPEFIKYKGWYALEVEE